MVDAAADEHNLLDTVKRLEKRSGRHQLSHKLLWPAGEHYPATNWVSRRSKMKGEHVSNRENPPGDRRSPAAAGQNASRRAE
jgi:hypothetical protein